MENLISLNLEATKIKEEAVVTNFIDSLTNLELCELKGIHKKSGYGCLLSTKFATFEELNNSEEFRFVLDQMNALGLKAHNAKNNYMKIVYKTNGYALSELKKVDLIILNNRELCKRVARKDKVFNFNFSEKMFVDLAKTAYYNNPIKWSDNSAEFVFFRSTLKFETIMASIEFVKTLFEFVHNNNISYEMIFECMSTTTAKYVQFAFDNSVYLKNYFQERSIKQ